MTILATSIVVTLSGCDAYYSWRTYSKAEDAYKQGDIKTAYTLLESIPSYGDSEDIRLDVKYQYANYLSTVKKYEKSVEIYETILEFKDAKTKLRATYKNWAEKLTALGEHGKALEIYEKLGEKEQAFEALLKQVDENINLGQYEKALKALEKISNNQKAQDLEKAAQKGALYLKMVASLGKNDFSTARKTMEKAVKIRQNKSLVFEGSYIEQYCTALKPVVSRLGSENKFDEVLKGVYPVWHVISEKGYQDCNDCLKMMNVAADRFFYSETNNADWHQKIDSYRERFTDRTARCNLYGGIMSQHLQRTSRLINVLMAMEAIGQECNDSLALNWEEIIKTVELNLSTMVLRWKKNRKYRKIIILQKYISSKLKDIPLELGNWGEFKEDSLLPEYKFTSTKLGDNKYMIAGWVKNPSNYRPLILSGVAMDCQRKDTGKIVANCAKTNFSRTILPSKRIALNGRAIVPSGTKEIVQFSLDAKFEDVNVSDVSAADLFSRDDMIPVVSP